jgi:hypothetical protein
MYNKTGFQGNFKRDDVQAQIIPCSGRGSADQQDRINENRLKTDWNPQTFGNIGGSGNS